jgi:ATP-binding cassette subfamily C exporter for protease/lipase
LDEVGEHMLIRAVLIAKQEGRTIMMISHKPSIVNAVSKIIVIRDGAVLDFGTKDEVMSKFTRGGTVPAKGMATAPKGDEKAVSEITDIMEDIKNKKTDT